LKLCREGLSKGITIILTSSDTSGGVSRFTSGFGQKVSFAMPADKFLEIFNAKVNPPMNLQGRGLINIENNIYEFQGFLPFRDEEKEFEGFQEKINAKFAEAKIEKLISFDGELTEENFVDFAVGKQSITEVNNSRDFAFSATVGLDYYDRKPISVDLLKTPSIGIYGKRQSGKTNLLWLLVERALELENEKGIRFVLFDDGRKQLEPFESFIKGKGIDVRVITQVKDMKNYLLEEGYYKNEYDAGYSSNYGLEDYSLNYGLEDYSAKSTEEITDAPIEEETTPVSSDIEKQNPFTIFIIQNKSSYTNKAGDLMRQFFPEMLAESENKWTFIFSDIKNITEMDMRNPFNDSLSVAFLLDNIGEFVADRGSKTIFGAMDAKELRETYARIEKGDGYFYDIESDELLKLKFVYSDTLKQMENMED
jgi:hypothetical protein